MTISKNAVAIVVVIFSLFGIDITDNMVLEFVGGLMQAVSIGLLVYHQVVERWETKGFFFKK